MILTVLKLIPILWSFRKVCRRLAAILREQMEDFYCWYDGRSLIPRIQDIQAEAVQDLNLRILKNSVEKHLWKTRTGKTF